MDQRQRLLLVIALSFGFITLLQLFYALRLRLAGRNMPAQPTPGFIAAT